jgi:CheY-like chemotaxis protein
MEIDPFKEMSVSTKALLLINEFESRPASTERLGTMLSLMAKSDSEKRIIVETVEKNLRENCPCHPEDISDLVSHLETVVLPTPQNMAAVSSAAAKTTVKARAVKSQFSMGFEAGLKAADSLASRHLASPDARPRIPPQPKHAVLIADDDDHLRLLFKIPLLKRGYRVVEAANGNDAWACISNGGIDLVILDLRMPGRHGLEILNEMRDRKMTLPVLTCSGYDLEDMPQVRNYPCLRYMAKPVKAEEVVDAIDALLDPTGR